jgi:hypothetical protein
MMSCKREHAMDEKAAYDERMQFSERLKQALIAASCPLTPHAFVQEFNLRADGVAVTVHAARKWLLGEAFPTQDKLKILANWLGVSSEWLRFGEDGEPAAGQAGSRSLNLEPFDRILLTDLHLLSERDRNVVRDLVDSLLRQL